MTWRGLLAGILLLGSVTGEAAAQDAAAIVRNASRVYRGLTSLRAQFSQVIQDRMIDTLESRGELLQAGNAQLVMRFSDPAGDMIVSDGEHVWFYLPSTTPGQVIRMELPSDPVYGPNMLARILDRPDERYQSRHLGVDAVGGRPVDVVELVPGSDHPPFLRAVVWFDRGDALPRRLEIDESGGQRRILVLSQLRTNTPIPRSAFTFTVPRGVRIVDQ